MRDRKLLILFLITLVFGFSVIGWYFFKATNKADPTLAVPTDPFGSAEDVVRGSEFVTGGNNPDGSENTSERIPASERVFAEVWDKPVGGHAFVTREVFIEVFSTSTPAGSTSTVTTSRAVKQTVEYLLFVDRITGYLYGYDPLDGAVFQITNTTTPGIYDAYITKNGTEVYMRSLAEDEITIQTLVATIPSFIKGADAQALTNIRSLQSNVSSFAVSETSNLVSYVVPTSLGSSIYSTNAKGVTSVSNSPFKEWSVLYGGETPYITTKPSAYLEGNTLSLPNQNFALGNKTGLMTLPHKDGDLFLASMWSRAGLAAFVFSKKTGAQTILDERTLASKCAWGYQTKIICGVPTTIPSTQDGLPDEWFRGSVSFSDNFYLVEGDQGADEVGGSTLIFALNEQAGQPFDVIKPVVNKNSTSLSFVNKRNGSLWFLYLSRLPIEE
jgi:hypothetical protein